MRARDSLSQRIVERTRCRVTHGISPHDVFMLIKDKHTTGSLAEVAKAIGKSRAYVSIMRKIDSKGTSTLIGAWRRGHIPFDLVREIVKMSASEQVGLVRNYMLHAKGKNKAERGRAKRITIAVIRSSENG